MLTIPDIWNDIAKIADKYFKVDYSNGNLPDLTNLDFNKMDKYSNNKS